MVVLMDPYAEAAPGDPAASEAASGEAPDKEATASESAGADVAAGGASGAAATTDEAVARALLIEVTDPGCTQPRMWRSMDREMYFSLWVSLPSQDGGGVPQKVTGRQGDDRPLPRPHAHAQDQVSLTVLTHPCARVLAFPMPFLMFLRFIFPQFGFT